MDKREVSVRRCVWEPRRAAQETRPLSPLRCLNTNANWRGYESTCCATAKVFVLLLYGLQASCRLI